MTGFDAVAGRYDRLEDQNPIVRHMRERTIRILEGSFVPGWRLLDIGAGTGADALALAAAGRQVVACDPSAGMLEVLTAKALAAGLEVAVHQLGAGGLEGLLPEMESAFDGAYSSFGGLNLEPDLGPAGAALNRLVRPGGRVVLGLMSRWALMEILGLALAGHPMRGLRRVRGRARPAVGGSPMPVTYHSVAAVRRALAPGFELEREEALALLVPPPSAWPRIRSRPGLVGRAASFDRRLAGIRPLTRLGDHVVLTFRRSG